jgi:hypothetical protein
MQIIKLPNNFLQEKCAFEMIKLHFEERQNFEVIFDGEEVTLILH